MKSLRIMSTKRALLGGTVAVGAALSVTATAFACTLFQGTFTVCGDKTPTSCAVSTGTGGMTYSQTGSTTISKLAGSINVSASGLTASKTYAISYLDPTVAATSGTKCPVFGQPIATATTDANGAYGPVSAPVVSPAVGTGYVCTYDPEHSTGNQATVTIL